MRLSEFIDKYFFVREEQPLEAQREAFETQLAMVWPAMERAFIHQQVICYRQQIAAGQLTLQEIPEAWREMVMGMGSGSI